jgi:hypothetical protein
MRVAPPVQAVSCSAGPWHAVQIALYAMSAAVAVGWAAAMLWEPGAAPLAAGLLAGPVAAVIARFTLPPHAMQLAWDGSAWQLRRPEREARAGRVPLMLDLGSWMLVRFSPMGVRRRGTVWLPLSRRDAAGAWLALRVALHASQPAA